LTGIREFAISCFFSSSIKEIIDIKDNRNIIGIYKNYKNIGKYEFYKMKN
jgi:hypothetical protein